MKFFDTAPPPYPLVAVSDYRRLAEKRLPKQLFNFIDGGAFDEITLRRNRDDFHNFHFRKRVLKDISSIDTQTEVLGQKLSMPVILAPVGFAGIFARRGEVQAARAANKAGIPFSLSAVGICSIEEVNQASCTPPWVQLYMYKDRGLTLKTLEQAEEIGSPVLILTVDLPPISVRHRYYRSKQASSFVRRGIEFVKHLDWYFDVRVRGGPLVLGEIARLAPHLRDIPSMRKWLVSQLNPSLIWSDLHWLRERWKGKLLVKGILDVEDARLAADAGIDGIVISNHGARHLDSTPSTISVLPRIAEAVGDRVSILLDGGITNGLDVAKALALGAKGCMIGRAWVFALAARGETGVGEVLSILQQELRVTMSQIGAKSVRELDRSILT